MGDPAPDPDRRDGGRHPSLLRRLFYANAAVLLIAGVLLVVTPVTISAPVTLGELRSRIVAMSFCEPRSCRLQLSS